ncbi:MAG: IS200/IS605 family transposase [Bacteroidia bacterium]
MSQTYHSIWLHLIWSTKNREPLLTKEIRFSLFDQIREISKENDYYLDFINGVEDHLHCLVCLKPKYAASDMVKQLKGASSKWLNEQGLIEGSFAWQDGYAVISVSPSHIINVRNYIKNQEKHHQEMSLKNELKSLEMQIEGMV